MKQDEDLVSSVRLSKNYTNTGQEKRIFFFFEFNKVAAATEGRIYGVFFFFCFSAPHLHTLERARTRYSLLGLSFVGRVWVCVFSKLCQDKHTISEEAGIEK